MKRIISMVLVALACLLCTLPANSYGLLERSEKISRELDFAMRQMKNEDELDVYIVLNDIKYEDVMKDFENQYPNEYSEYMVAKWGSNEELKKHGEIQIDLLQTAIGIKRELFANCYYENNQTFIDEFVDKEKQVFVSRYSPVVIATMNRSAIAEIVKQDKVASMELYVNTDCKPDLAKANIYSGAKKVRDDYSCKGEGVIIGQIEPGVPDISNTDLQDATITIHGTCNNATYNSHATTVARIMVGKTNGIAPRAALCSATAGTSSAFYVGVELLIDDNVNVINMSAGFETNLGTYDAMSRWIDHIAINHDVHFVKSAGNRNIAECNYDRKITSPGMAYNVITVGGFYDYSNDSPADDIRYSASSYLETGTQNRPEKPNLIADAKNVYVGENHTGTSFAAPQCTGVIAQLCSYDDSLLLRQTEMGALLLAGAAFKLEGTIAGHYYCGFQTAYCVENNNSGDKNRQISVFEGAGKLNAEKAYKIAVDHTHYKATIYANSFPYTKTIVLSSESSIPVRIVIFWLKRNSFESTTPHVTQNPNPAGNIGALEESDMSNLNLRVYAPSGTEVGYSTTKTSNYEIVQFVPPQTGTYRIVISKSGENNSEKEYVGIAVLKNN